MRLDYYFMRKTQVGKNGNFKNTEVSDRNKNIKGRKLVMWCAFLMCLHANQA